MCVVGFTWIVIVTFSEKRTFEQSVQEVRKPCEPWGVGSVLCGGNSQCKGPLVGVSILSVFEE